MRPFGLDLRKITVHYGVTPLVAIVVCVLTGASAFIVYSVKSKKDVWLRNQPYAYVEPPPLKYTKVKLLETMSVPKPSETLEQTDMEEM